jgi:hypothetical protein
MTRLRQEPSVMRAALGVPAPVIETTGGNPPALAAKTTTATIPIIFVH